MTEFEKKIVKPWGHEIIFTPPEALAVGKLLHINAGAKISLQYHEIKEETLILINGEAKIVFGLDKNNLTEKLMKPNVGYFISKGLIHRIIAVSDCDLFESSTKEEGVTVRIEDDYNRGNETEEERTTNRM